jgi:hypothetical protein
MAKISHLYASRAICFSDSTSFRLVYIYIYKFNPQNLTSFLDSLIICSIDWQRSQLNILANDWWERDKWLLVQWLLLLLLLERPERNPGTKFEVEVMFSVLTFCIILGVVDNLWLSGVSFDIFKFQIIQIQIFSIYLLLMMLTISIIHLNL